MVWKKESTFLTHQSRRQKKKGKVRSYIFIGSVITDEFFEIIFKLVKSIQKSLSLISDEREENMIVFFTRSTLEI